MGSNPGGTNGGSPYPAKTITQSIRLLLEIQNPVARGNAYVQQIASQHDDPTFTDVILVCNETEIPSHRVILAARSELFKMMLSSSSFKEGLTRRVEIEEMSLNTLKAMLNYIYTDDFEPDDINLCELYTTADRFMIAGLVQKCESYMHESLSVERAAEYFLLSHLHLPALTKLNEATKRFITEKFQDVKKTKGWIELKKNPDALEAILDFSISISQPENSRQLTLEAARP